MVKLDKSMFLSKANVTYPKLINTPLYREHTPSKWCNLKNQTDRIWNYSCY